MILLSDSDHDALRALADEVATGLYRCEAWRIDATAVRDELDGMVDDALGCMDAQMEPTAC